MPGHHILEGVVVLHEAIHETNRKKLDGVLFQIDFKKAYDKVKWPFIQQVLRMKGFDPKWCDLIKKMSKEVAWELRLMMISDIISKQEKG
jgi:hypothetical protein